MTSTRRLLLQVTLPSIVVGVVLLTSSLIGVWGMNRLQHNRARLMSSHVQRLQVVREMEVLLRKVRSESILYLFDPKSRRDQLYKEACGKFEHVYGQAVALAELPSERKLLDDVYAGYLRYRDDLVASHLRGSLGTRKALLRWIDTHTVSQLLVPCEDLFRINTKVMEETSRESEEVSDRGRNLFLLMGLLGPVGGLIGGFGAAWGLSRSITRMRIRLQDASAHLDHELGSVRVTGEGSSDHLDRQLDFVVNRMGEAITRIQQHQREMIRAEQLAAIGQLAAGVAHEVRNPLTGIKLLVSASLTRQPGCALTTEDLQFIHGEIERLEKKVQDLLGFARPSGNTREPWDLRDLVRQALQLVQTRVQQTAIDCKMDLPADPVRRQVDPNQMTSVLVNLFLNALDAMPQGGTLKVSLHADSGGAVRLTVSDSGPGIDPALIDHLFTPFASTKKSGTGLGLSISRRIVLDHGGTLGGSNRPEGGACFTMVLPPTGG